MRITNQGDERTLLALKGMESEKFNRHAGGAELLSRYPCVKVATGSLDRAPQSHGFPYKGMDAHDGAFGS